VESGGVARGEAENYHEAVTRSGVSWMEELEGEGDFSNSSGGAYMISGPDGSSGVAPYPDGACIEYQIEVSTTGTYRLWLRWAGNGGGSDSIFAGIVELGDGPGGAPDWYEDSGHATADFDDSDWDSLGEAEANTANAAQNPMVWEISSPGTYTLRVAIREDGSALDAWALQLDSLPPPGEGPPVAVDDAITMGPNRKAGVPVLANDLTLDNLDRIEVIDAPAFGTATVSGNTILYTHDAGSPASDAFQYRLVDTLGQASAAATVDITFSSALRLPNTTLTVPAEPPAEALGIQNAFPGMSFNQPLSITSPPGETDRVFVCEKPGRVQVVTGVDGGAPAKSEFLDLPGILSGRTDESMNTGSESGLLGMDFHPDYATNGYFYVFYSVNVNGQRHQRVSRFTASGDPNAADPNSEVVLIDQRDDAGNHNGGDVRFGPDGYLYVTVGDEGGSNDTFNNSQRITKDYFSGILRIDVDKRPGNLEPNPHPSVKTDNQGAAFYSVPADNPWVGATSFNGAAVNPDDVIMEFYAVGLRNPWRIHFDPATGELYCADVGQNAREEINIIRAGGNYGWAFFEASLDGPDNPPPGFTQDEPIYEYSRGDGEFQGRSISGGVVYRGANFPGLVGKYVFGDYTSGNIWTLERDGDAVTVERITGTSGPVSFGYDPSNGDVLIASINNGRVERLASAGPSGDFPATLSETGVFADLSDLSPNPGVLHYEPNLAFWSDYGIKDRWFVIPDESSVVTYSLDGSWDFPAGMVWIKHFEIELARGDPDTRKRLETRLLVRNDEGVYGVSYRWNDEETEAFLVASEGENFVLDIEADGEMIQQSWRIPSRAECLSCHLPNAGHALSFNTRQLNRDYPLGGVDGNQIDTLRDAGYLVNAPSGTGDLPRHLRPDETDFSLEARVRSYLAVNCAYCHQPGSSAPANWDARPQLTLEETQLIRGEPNNDGGDAANKLVVPGDAAHSVVLSRIAASGGFTRMPPIATNEIDPGAVALVTDWIENELPLTYEPYADWRLVHFGSPDSAEGAPGANPDGDAHDNGFEWLARTDPNDPNSQWRPAFSHDDGQLNLLFDRILNRVTEIESSRDLVEWAPLEAAGNHAYPSSGGAGAVSVPVEDDAQFFRFRFE